MNYEKIKKIAEELEKQLGLSEAIEENIVDEIDEVKDLPEPSLEAEDKLDVDEFEEIKDDEDEEFVEAEDESLTASERRANVQKVKFLAAKRLNRVANALNRKKNPLNEKQKIALKRFLTKVASIIRIAEGEEEELKKNEVVRSLGTGFAKSGPLRQRLNWDNLKTKGITPMTKLNEMTLENVRYLLTQVKGVN